MASVPCTLALSFTFPPLLVLITVGRGSPLLSRSFVWKHDREGGNPFLARLFERKYDGKGFPPSRRVRLCRNTTEKGETLFTSRWFGRKHGGKGFPPLVMFVCAETRPRRGNPLVGVSVWKETQQRRGGPLLGVPVYEGHTTRGGFLPLIASVVSPAS